MKLKTLYLENFRGYKEKTKIEFGDLTTFIGKNDIGKSTVLEALEIFFNNDLIKMESSDANIHGGKEVILTCDFCELPKDIILDSGEKTNLSEEYLTIDEDLLRIKKVYDCNKSKISPIVYIVAKHPSIEEGDLLSLKEKELQKIVKDKGLDVSLKGNPSMRKAIWNAVDNLYLEEKEIEISKTKEDGKEIWSKIDSYLPNFALFQSDRSNHDTDDEVQNPMKVAIQEAISEVQDEINSIQQKVQDKAMQIAEQTQNALKLIDSHLANDLTPNFNPPVASKWNSLFSITMNTDEGIALNKRGSGVRRMILVGFFKAAAERQAKSSNKKNIIYAIEEPETAQHPNNQKILIHSFLELSKSDNCQVILTTHSPNLAQELPVDSLRFINRDESNNIKVLSGNDILPQIVETLGIFPNVNKNIKLIICLEGPTDIIAFKSLNKCLRDKYPNIVDIENDQRILVIPLGGSILKYWVEEQYLKTLKCREVHIYDNDVKKYKDNVDKINNRKDGSWGVLTNKYEIENYLNSKAVKDIYGIEVDTSQKDVPKLFAEAYSKKEKFDGTMKDNKAKTYLSKVFQEGMTVDYLEEIDPQGEVKGWFKRITSMLQS